MLLDGQSYTVPSLGEPLAIWYIVLAAGFGCRNSVTSQASWHLIVSQACVNWLDPNVASMRLMHACFPLTEPNSGIRNLDVADTSSTLIFFFFFCDRISLRSPG